MKTSFLTLMLAAVFALSLVPAGAWATDDTKIANYTTDGQSGILGTDSAEIKIANPKAGETYTVYRLFELASFDDENAEVGQHGTTNDLGEAYSYVIDENSGWFHFLTNYGPTGASDSNKYAVYATDDSGNATNPGSAYFLIEREKVTVNGNSSYHVITAVKTNFDNAWDDTTGANSRNENGSAASTGSGPDYTSDSTTNRKVQDFAQEALKYATNPAAGHEVTPVSTVVASTNSETVLLDSSTHNQSQEALLGYYLVGTSMGTLASLDTTNASVTINEKNDEPEIEKKVLKKGGSIPATSNSFDTTFLTGDNSGTWVDNTDGDIGDYVMFRTIITAQQGMDRYVLHDIMENGFTLVNGTVDTTVEKNRYTGKTDKDYSIKVYLVTADTTPAVYVVPETASATGVTDGRNYTLKAVTAADSSNKPTDDCDFEIAFQDFDGSAAGNNKVTLAVTPVSGGNTVVRDVKDGDKIVVTYWAQVNSNAIVFNNTGAQNGQTDSDKESSKTHNSPSITASDGSTAINADDDVKHDNNSDERNSNHTVLTYGDKGYTKFEKATVTTYQFDIVKTNGYETSNNAGDTTLLQGAEFNLFRAHVKGTSEDVTSKTTYELGKGTNNTETYVVEGTALPFAENANNEYTYNADTTATEANVKLKSSSAREIHLEGLEAGTYLLVETVAPTGYNKLAKPVAIVVNGGSDTTTTSVPGTDEGTIKSLITANSGATSAMSSNGAWDASVTPRNGNASTYTLASNGGLQVVNQTGQELPSTGGIGTTVFYVAGTVLVVGAGVMLVAKRRMNSEA